LKSLVDNVTTYAVELLLVQKLEGFLSPSRIIKMNPKLVQKTAAESPITVGQREQLRRKLEVLVAGIETCRCYVNHGLLGKKLLSWEKYFHRPY